MGFLKFLKRDKGKEPNLGLEDSTEDLDVPPPPPDLVETGFGSEKKELPEFPELPEMPEAGEPTSKIEETPLPELPELKTPSMPEFPELKEDIESKPLQPLETKPDIEFPKPVESMGIQKPSQAPKPVLGAPKPLFMQPRAEVPEPAPKIKPYERFERAAVREERGVLRHKDAQEPIYIRVDRFKGILTGANMIKNNLKIINQSIARVDEIDANKDTVLEKWRNVMVDIQKKLIFIDKTLFRR